MVRYQEDRDKLNAGIEQIEVRALAFGGKGVGALSSGKTVFVAGGVPGDTLAVRLISERENFAEAEIVRVAEPSPARVAPNCPHSALCGACPMQHVALEQLRVLKRRFVVDALARIGGFKVADELVGEMQQAKDAWHYRNKVELQAGVVGGKLILGYASEGSHKLADISKCLLLPKPLIDLPKKLSGVLNFAFKQDKQQLKRVAIRTAKNTDDLEIALWTEPGAMNRAFVAKLLDDAVKTTSLVRVLIKGTTDKRKVVGTEVLSGKGFWRERLHDIDYFISAPSFFQTNTEVAELMMTKVLELISPDKPVIDLYAGAGTFTLALAEVCDDVTAVESAASSIRDLRRNLENNQLHAEVIGGAVEYSLSSLKQNAQLVVDPPRAGLSKKAFAAITALAPQSIIYISCDPATLARDLRKLADAGYTPQKITPFDMFAQSYHVESVAYLTK